MPLAVFPALFNANSIFKDFSRQSCIFKYFSSLCEPCAFSSSPDTAFFFKFMFQIFFQEILSQCQTILIEVSYMCESRRGGGGGGGGGYDSWPLPEKSQSYRVPKQYWSGSPWKSQSYHVGPSSAHQQNSISMVFHCWANGGPLLVLFGSSLLLSTTKKNVRVRLLWQNFLDLHMC